jgi:hypothetical protein
MTRGGALWLVVLLLLAVPRAAPGEEEGWLLNYDQLRQVGGQAVAELLEGFPAPAGAPPVRVVFGTSHETAWMVEELVVEELGRQGVAVTVDSLTTARELEIKVVEMGLRYTGTHRRRWLGSKVVERLAVATLSGRMSDVASGTIAWNGGGEVRVIDEVPEKQLRILEGDTYPFTAPQIPATNASRVVEPIVVSAIVVGLVFLFVANRS